MGTERNKALKAVKQAINHPLMGEVSVENAAGVIANFTAGSDLSLVEVSTALMYLQDQTNNSTEIVMGTTQKENMADRVQVNLVITGLGAQPRRCLAGIGNCKAENARTAPNREKKPVAVRSDGL